MKILSFLIAFFVPSLLLAQKEFKAQPEMSDQAIISAVKKSAPYTVYKDGQCLEYVKADGDEIVEIFRETVTDIQVKYGLYVVTVKHTWLPEKEMKKPVEIRKYEEGQSFTTEIDPHGTYHLIHNLQFDKFVLKIKERNGYAVLMPSEMKVGQTLEGSTMQDVIAAAVGKVKPIANYTNVKVVGKEKVTTPAGTFDCVKITGDFYQEGKWVKTHRVKYKFNWWFAKGLGLVKSEALNIESNSILGPDCSVIYLNCINPEI